MKKRKKKTNKKKILVFLGIILIVAASIGSLIFFGNNRSLNKDDSKNKKEPDVELNVDQPKSIKIVDVDSKTRPYAVMINNISAARPYHSGLQDAMIVYEMIVEGGITRMMAVFKDQTTARIGSVRSSRHYFLDYALENDAIYVHYGWSPQAKRDISKLKVNNINGITESATDFWRVKDKSAPHNAVTSTKNILNIAQNKGYSTTSNKKSVLNYVSDDVELDGDEQEANSFSIKYSDYNTASYTYNAETKRYLRYTRGIKQVDWNTNEDVTVKNIIITFVKNTTLDDGENKGRQTLDNVGTRDGYYITNGKAIKIKCEKKSRTEQTVYKDLNGNEIKVNDGNTFIQT